MMPSPGHRTGPGRHRISLDVEVLDAIAHDVFSGPDEHVDAPPLRAWTASESLSKHTCSALVLSFLHRSSK
jgi:hypothetical protein